MGLTPFCKYRPKDESVSEKKQSKMPMDSYHLNCDNRDESIFYGKKEPKLFSCNLKKPSS